MIVFTVWVSCTEDNSIFGDYIEEGRIEYAVSFPHMEPDNVMSSILPEKMYVNFKGNKYNSEFNTYGGVFKNRITVDTEQRKYSQMLKIFKKRLACEYDKVDIDEMMLDFPPFTIIQSDIIDTLAGIPCKKAKGVFYDIEAEEIDIYYTDRIKVKNPNWCSPFSELDGFLMGYDVDMFDIRLRLTAKNLEQMPIDESEFSMAEDYKMVSYKYIKVEIEKLMDSFDI
ncbi:MAG: hypothetical protein HKN79_12575 [Flavobacteriales bacterium]|nr:hypothetical protein [Flavobacteriales bacterium]